MGQPTRLDRTLAAHIARVAKHVYDLSLETELYDEHSPVFRLLEEAKCKMEEAEKLLLHSDEALE
jgi:hypothetical protein